MQRYSIGIAFLAYAGHPQWQHAVRRFAESYDRHPAGIDHRLYIIFKGYAQTDHLREAERLFSGFDYTPIYLNDRGFGIQAYKIASLRMQEDMIGFLNTKSEILSSDWLLKFARQLSRPDVGLVGNTGSFESASRNGLTNFPEFPNVHIRTNAFLIRANLFRAVARRRPVETRLDGWKLESGWNSLSREVLRRGLKIVVVGRDDRGYEPRQWPASGTYRSLPNANLLIADDDYRQFSQLDATARTALVRATWGGYVESPAKSDEELFVHSPLSQTRTHWIRLLANSSCRFVSVRRILTTSRALFRRYFSV